MLRYENELSIHRNTYITSTLSRNVPNDTSLDSKYMDSKSSVMLANGKHMSSEITDRNRYREEIIMDIIPILLNFPVSFNKGAIKNR